MSRYWRTPTGLPIPSGSVGFPIGPFGIPMAMHAPAPVLAPVPVPIPVPVFAHVHHPVHPPPSVAPIFATSSSRYDSVTVVVITRGPTGRRHILMHFDGGPFSGRASILVDDLHGRDARTTLDKMICEYDLDHFGKKTYIDHHHKATNQRTLCCVVYAPELSRHRINSAFLRHHPHTPPLVRFLIDTHHHHHHKIETDSHSVLPMSDWTYQLVHSIDHLWSSFV